MASSSELNALVTLESRYPKVFVAETILHEPLVKQNRLFTYLLSVFVAETILTLIGIVRFAYKD